MSKPVDHVRHHRGRAPEAIEGGYGGLGRGASPMDRARVQRARAAVAGERDKLLKQGTQRLNLSKFMPRSSKDRARACLITLGLAVVGMLGYIVMIAEWFFVFHNSFAQTAVVLIVLLLASVSLCVASTKKALGKDRPWLLYVGCLLAVSTALGAVVGFALYFHYVVYYWKYTEMRTYTNVAAAQSDQAFKDGGMFLFTEDSKVDVSQAVGFQSRWTGKTYCTAPVVDSTMGGSDNIYYWAIGEGCCQPRASFYCNDAMDQAVRSALVLLQPLDIVRPFMQWAVRDSDWNKYMSAIKLAEGNYYIKAAPQPAMVYWTKDPMAMRDSFYNNAKSAAITFGAVYALIELLACYFLAWTLLPKSRHPAVLRQTA